MTRICALEAPCCAFYEERRPPVVTPIPPPARRRCSAAQLQPVLPVVLAFAIQVDPRHCSHAADAVGYTYSRYSSYRSLIPLYTPFLKLTASRITSARGEICSEERRGAKELWSNERVEGAHLGRVLVGTAIERATGRRRLASDESVIQIA